MSRKESMLAMLRRQQSDITQRMLALEKLPDEDIYADGAMIRVVVDGGRLTYLLLKVVVEDTTSMQRSSQDRWFFTGSIPRNSNPWLRWEQLQSWLGEAGLESWDELIPVTTEVMEVLRDTALKHVNDRVDTVTTDLRAR